MCQFDTMSQLINLVNFPIIEQFFQIRIGWKNLIEVEIIKKKWKYST